MQFVKATYDTHSKRSALTTLVKRVTEALEDRSNVQGEIEGPWTKSLVDMVSFCISELALDVLVSFKSEEYAKELEWRLVVRPPQYPCSSDRISADRDFEVLVKNQEDRKYVELFVPIPVSPFLPLYRSPVPFDSVTVSPFEDADRLRELAHRILNENFRPDITIDLAQV